MTGAPPTTSDCNTPLTGAPGIGSTDLLDDVLGVLTERERLVLRLRLGLDGERWTLQRIGEKYHVGRERIRSIEAKALRKLSRPSHKELIEELRSHVTETQSSNAPAHRRRTEDSKQ